MIQLIGIGALAGGMVFAQAASPSTSGSPTTRRDMMRQHFAQMEQKLNLTDAQKQQAHSIFRSARESSQSIRTQLKENREALAAAAKAGKSDSTIQELATKQGHLLGQEIAIHTQAYKKFYSMLTPDQRTKADQIHQQFRERMRNRAGQHPQG
jgi:Spy/CpxP family protein refolding chaperone